MLDSVTKNRINTARDILVGKVPDPKSQVEQITIALIYKFMDDMDVEAEELGGKRTFFSGEYGKYSWRKIFDPRQSGHELLNLYGEAITKMDTNPGVPKLFRDIFKNAYLPYRDPETLKSFLKIINEFEYTHSEKLGDAFEFLLSILGSQGDAGQFRTPRHIIDFMVAIIDPKKNEVILDPACGTAGFLISSYKHIIKQNSSNYIPDEAPKISTEGTQSVNEVILTTNGYTGDKLTADERRILADNMHGYDISPDMVRLSLVNMYLHGVKEPQIFEYDSLTSEDHWNEYSDVILANPPFMSPKGGIRPHKRFSVQSNRSEVLFVDYIAEHLTQDGRAVVIVPEGIIFQSGNAYKQLRKMLVDKYLVGVISLPAGVFQPYSGVKTSILWLDKSLVKKTDKILFVKIENDGFDLGAQRRAVKGNDLPKAQNNILQYKINCISREDTYFDTENLLLIERKIISLREDYNLSHERYNKPVLRSNKFHYCKLAEIAEISSGDPAPQADKYFINGEHPFIRTSDVGRVHISSSFCDCRDRINDLAIQELKPKLFKKSTILIPKSGASTFLNHRALLSIDAFISSHLAGITPYINQTDPKFLFYMLCRVDAKNLTVDQNYPSLRISDISSITIPMPSLSEQEKIVAEIDSYQKIIDGARQVVENYKTRIEIDPDWEMVELKEVCEIKAGGTPLKLNKEFWEGNIPWYSSGELNETYTSDPKEYITKEGLQHSNATLFPKGSLLIGMYDTAAFKMSLLDREATFNQAVCGLKPNDEVDLYFIMLFFKMNKEEYLSHRVGVRQRNLNKGFISEIKIPKISLETQRQIVAQIEKEQVLVNANKELVEIFETKIKDRIAKVWGE
jgi:type I restriction enzyme M protein